MTKFGYTMMCEQSRPDQLVRDIRKAEEAGFDFSVISDHYQPWLESQGHSGYAWAILGAAAQATERIPLMTYVTCPILRYHPAVVAQKAATVQILSGNRFRLGLGAGENLNEHVVGRGTLSARCSTPARTTPSTIAASTTTSSPLGCGTCPTSVCRSASRCPVPTPASSPARRPT
jgi:G6PDH family F420-dependent oxidoreductase